MRIFLAAMVVMVMGLPMLVSCQNEQAAESAVPASTQPRPYINDVTGRNELQRTQDTGSVLH